MNLLEISIAIEVVVFMYIKWFNEFEIFYHAFVT